MSGNNNEIKGNGVFSAADIMRLRPENTHMGSQTRSDSCDISDMIDKSGCSREYYALEECMGESNRSWSKCQEEVKRLQQCSAKVRKS